MKTDEVGFMGSNSLYLSFVFRVVSSLSRGLLVIHGNKEYSKPLCGKMF